MAVLVGWALLASGFTVLALVRLGRRREATAVPQVAPPVLLLRPADALRPGEARTLAVPCHWPAALDHVVLSPEPPPLPPGGRWLRSDPSVPNRKIGHLLHALSVLPHDGRVVCAVDADVAVDARLLAALVTPLLAGAPLVTAAPEPVPARGLGPRAARAVLVHTHQSFVALDALSIGPKAICGKAMALGAQAIAALPALCDRLGEDLDLAKWLHARGHRPVLAAAPARLPQEDGAPVTLALDRFTRWMQVLRAHRPGLFPAVPLLFAPSLPLVLGALAVPAPALVAAVVVLWGVRSGLAWRLGRRGWLAWPLGEAILAVAFARALLRRTVVWRGRSFRVRRHGRMEPLPA